MKKLIIVILIAILVFIGIQSYYNSECMNRSYDNARLTIQGVYCHKDGLLVEHYDPLKDIPLDNPIFHYGFGTT